MPRQDKLISAATLALVLLGLAGCGSDTPHPNAPKPRVVSFSPAITRMMFDIGLGDHVVGVTRYCQLPEGQSRTVVGDAQDVQAETVLFVEPDVLLIQQKPDRFQAVRQARPRVKIEEFRIETLDDIAHAVTRLGDITGRAELANNARLEFRNKISKAQTMTVGVQKPRVAFLLGMERPASPGRGTFLDEMIRAAAGVNVMAQKYEGWQSVSLTDLVRLKADVIVCQAREDQRQQAVERWEAFLDVAGNPKRRVVVVTERDWTIPSVHLADRTLELARLLHPQLAGGAARQ